MSHVFYECGPYNDERKSKIKWLNADFARDELHCSLIESILSNERKQIKRDKKYAELSNLIQLCDLLLGVCKWAFIKVENKHDGRQKCVDSFIDIVENFNGKKTAYNSKNGFYRKFCLGFFPGDRISKKDFIEKKLTYFMKNKFYCDRPTYGEKIVQKSNLSLF